MIEGRHKGYKNLERQIRYLLISSFSIDFLCPVLFFLVSSKKESIMDLAMGKGGNKGLIIRTWERCRSLGRIGRKNPNSPRGQRAAKLRSKSWTPRCGIASEADEKGAKTCKIAPQGCFSVYVGPKKQRFVIRTECLNHPLFKMLLEEAESEYGYNCEGPLELPCEVDLFTKVLLEMDSDDIPPRCNFARTYSSYHLLTPPRLFSFNKFS